jgi:hypothetical protein
MTTGSDSANQKDRFLAAAAAVFRQQSSSHSSPPSHFINTPLLSSNFAVFAVDARNTHFF